MKLSVETHSLINAVSEVIKGVASKSTLPVLEHINMELKGNKLKLITTDQDVIIKTYVDVIGFEDGAILTPAARFNELLQAVKDNQEIEFVAIGTDITIKSKGEKYEFKGLSHNEYLELPEIDYTGNSISINRSDFQKAMNVSFSCSSDEFRPAMTGVYIHTEKDKLNFISTDSYRLTRLTIDNPFGMEVSVIVPKKTADLFKKTVSDVELSLIGNETYTHVKFKLGNTEIISRLINEKFPPYQSVIPTSNDKELIVNKVNMLKAIKKVKIMASKHSKQIVLSISDNVIKMLSEDADSGNNAKVSIGCQCNFKTNEPFEFGFNYSYLIDALENCNSENEIKLTFSENTKPCLLEDENQLFLIMPVRLS